MVPKNNGEITHFDQNTVIRLFKRSAQGQKLTRNEQEKISKVSLNLNVITGPKHATDI